VIIDIGDPLRNVVLNVCFYGIVAVTLLSVIPWRLAGGANRWSLFLPLIGLTLYVIYEMSMPARWDIRVDLLLLVPLACLIVVSWVIRLIVSRRRAR
jgi:hypothetical protein